MKKLVRISEIIGLFIIMASCSNDNNTKENQMRVSAKGVYETAAAKSGISGIPNDIVLTSFKINATALTLTYYDGDDNDNQGKNDGHDYQNVTVYGPWELDLLNQTSPITSVTVPNGTYKKAELEISKSLDPLSAIYNKTVEIKGIINGTPFVFWHNFDQILLLKYEDELETAIIHNNSFDLVFDFNLNTLVDSIDVSDAVDGNGDGIIEIGPNDTDGNNELAELLNQHMGGCGGIEHHVH